SRGQDDCRARQGPGARGRGAEERDRGRPGKPGAVSVFSRLTLRAAEPDGGDGEGQRPRRRRQGNAAMKLLPAGWNRRMPLALGALVLAAANAVIFLGYRSSTNERRAALEARRDDLARTVASREAEAEKLSTQNQRLSGVSEAMEEFYGHRIGTQEETLAGLVADLH